MDALQMLRNFLIAFIILMTLIVIVLIILAVVDPTVHTMPTGTMMSVSIGALLFVINNRLIRKQEKKLPN
ncbi:hypothetical protein [Geomicrobium sp. JCM 19039]|uniref:hypothetical protein n=1 Tax=Geomicrobium sp. JCM 19039 TaxID=1460636 RepID=UPI0005A5E511|nr:hypothetical protein [Geomicrobium sp. JCM 19039]